MFREMRRKKRAIESKEDIEKVLIDGEYGVLATIGENGYPYSVPLNYVYNNGCIYFHCAKEGHKLDNMAYNERVSFCVVGSTKVVPSAFTCRYESVILFGKGKYVEGKEKEEALIGLIKKYSKDHMESGLEYIKKGIAGTTVMKIEVEQVTGKKTI